jgi:hypothetical protein
VAAIEARVNAGETINLTDLSDAIKKDKQAAQTGQTGKNTPQTPAKTTARKPAQTHGKPATTPNPPEQPSIKEKIEAGRKEIAAKKPAPARAAAQTKTAEIGG